MPHEHLPKRFFAGTRGRILTLLRRESRTVDALAQVLDLTGNAIRVQLTALERDGLVQQQQSERRGVGKPAYLYRLTPLAENLFPRAHERVLDYLLDLLAERMDPDEIDTLLRAVGGRMAASGDSHFGNEPHAGASPDNLRARLEEAVDTLNRLGGLAELEEHEDSFSICGYSCPFGRLAQDHPNLCTIMQSMLTSLLGVPVQERCARGETLWCQYIVPR